MQENRNCFYIIPETGSKFLKFCKRDDTLLASNFEPTEMECACFYLLEWRLRNTTSGQHQFQRFASLNGTSKILPTNNTEFKKKRQSNNKNRHAFFVVSFYWRSERSILFVYRKPSIIEMSPLERSRESLEKLNHFTNAKSLKA